MTIDLRTCKYRWEVMARLSRRKPKPKKPEPVKKDREIRAILRELYHQERQEHKARKLSHAIWLRIGDVLGEKP